MAAWHRDYHLEEGLISLELDNFIQYGSLRFKFGKRLDSVYEIFPQSFTKFYGKRLELEYLFRDVV